ncbi:hypothetical protein GCM10025868_41870 [Angustibacter aerolatus]|uniref:Flagellar biosynthesis protein FlhA n=1 Tax=Angustibacter aerolatus TaxID=1162965 RepID=A0ABQ6JQ17_9ACTN|nr:hypothetical protein GCM10025868_41870 [Angustibacter aerolatus]
MRSRAKASQAALPIGIVGIVLLLVVPLPAVVLDLLIAMNITLAIAVLLVSISIKRPLDFSVFPSMILVLTLLRLSLNVSATRLVLRDGYAGKVIGSFGHFVVGGSLVIGLVIFLILIVIQFAVITAGAGRVAEVGARFTLDAMPGKQMAIDADLNSGLITEDEARVRRADVAAEADFYGAMDGGSKFVKGDAIAAIIITLINLVGGFAIGMIQRGMAPVEALQTYSLLTIGDGLVSQIPALLLSVSTGLIVTRSTTNGDMATDATQQARAAAPRAVHRRRRRPRHRAHPRAAQAPFIVIGAVVLLLAQRASRAQSRAAQAADVLDDDAPAQQEGPEALMGEMRVDPLEVVLAPDLVDLVDTGVGGDLLDRVRALRRKARHAGSDWSCRRCAPATASTCRRPATRSASAASRSAAARRPRPRARDRRRARQRARPPHHRAGLRPGRQVGARRGPPAGRACTARPSSTGPACSSRTWPRSCRRTPPGCSAARTSRR